MENKKSLSTIMFIVAIVLFACATFAMFGAVATLVGTTFPNMFQAAFGLKGPADSIRTPGLTTLFVFQMVILALIVAIIFGAVTNKFHYVLMIVLYGLLCLCAFIAFIVSFNTLNLYFGSGHTPIPDTKLGPGPIIYSIMHILGLISSAAGLVFSRRG